MFQPSLVRSSQHFLVYNFQSTLKSLKMVTTLCRLCADEKPPEEIVIKLSDNVSGLTFQQTVEFYCRIDLSADPDLPQTVCKDCKISLGEFMRFSSTVEEKQKVFVKETKNVLQEPFDDEDLLVEVPEKEESKSPKPSPKVENARPTKRSRQDDLDEEVDLPNISQKKEPMQRRKSMAVESTSQPLAVRELVT